MSEILEISSKDNPEIKILKKLSQKKYRLEHKLFIVENATIILDALKAGTVFKSLFLSDEYLKKNTDTYKHLNDHKKSAKIFKIDQKLNRYFSGLDTPSGICAVYEMSPLLPLLPHVPCIYLNGINDPGNLGTIMRTMLAFGFRNLIVDENCADIYNAKTISAAKDSIFKINIHKDNKLTWLKQAKKEMPIYTSDVSSGKDLDNFVATDEFCLVLGSESHGVSPEIADLATEKLNIRISDNIESLNVASAAAIFFYKLAPKKIKS